MPSKKSYFNPVLYRKNLSRFWPLWGGVSLVGCVAPLYMLLMLLSRGGAYIRISSVSNSIYAVLVLFVPGFLLVYASLCGVLTWGYLSNSRSVGLYHTLPVSRTCLFFTSLASGLTMLLLPFVIVGALSSLVLLCFGILPLEAVAWAAVLVIGMCVLFFSLITLAAMVSGNSFAVLAFYYLGNFLAAMLDWLLSSFSGGFLFGITSNYTGRVEFFSPVLYIYNHFTTYRAEDSSYQLSGTWCIGVYALVGIVLLALSLLLYHRRKSESAGDVVAQNWLKPIFRYGVALLSGLTLGQVLYTFVYTIPFGSSRYKSIVPMTLCVLVTALLGYYVASMLLKKSLRVFRRNWQGPLTTAAIVVILCGCVSLDVFGSVSYVPDLQEVDDVVISFFDHSFNASGDSQLAQEIAAAHRAVLKDEAYIRSMTSEGDSYAYTTDDSEYLETMETTLYLSYRMKNGTTVQRQYALPLVRDRWYNQPDTFDYLLRQAVYGPESSVAAVTPVAGETLDSLYGEYWDNGTGDAVSFNLSGDGVQRIYDGVLADAAAGTLYDDDIFRYDYYNNGVSGSLEFSFRYWSEETMSREVEFVRVELSPTMTNTMAALEEEAPEWFAQMSQASQRSVFEDTVSMDA